METMGCEKKGTNIIRSVHMRNTRKTNQLSGERLVLFSKWYWKICDLSSRWMKTELDPRFHIVKNNTRDIRFMLNIV